MTSINEGAAQLRSDAQLFAAIATLASIASVFLCLAFQIVRSKWLPADDHGPLAATLCRAASIDDDRQEALLAALSSIERAELASNLAELCALDAATEAERSRACFETGARIWHEPIECAAIDAPSGSRSSLWAILDAADSARAAEPIGQVPSSGLGFAQAPGEIGRASTADEADEADERCDPDEGEVVSV